MDDGDVVQVPSGPCVMLNVRQLVFGHAGIMFQRHGCGGIIAFGKVSHQTNEGDDGAALLVGVRQRRNLGIQVKVFGLHTDHRPNCSHGMYDRMAPSSIWSSP